ncbi:glycosyltransferase [Adhaeretor mobilis]|uniref:Putative glycosyltransferase EpsJ n=1 Tax=Adhaeretor mobilis TaxID=1930276 RepID=A0A517MYN3_9BACT|nr:glycosyltransferase family A protein [Adhaeretor mobilis]QDS99991.1 putative glycosyltransferase EpsJ [Adhaeretor mobilis]
MSSKHASTITLSVIIPVYNQADYLEQCLDALAHQTLPSDQFEVIVIDNGSDVPPREIVESHNFARYGVEPRPGSFAARNHAIPMAKGKILAFTDSDCLPHADWLEAAITALQSPASIDVVAGRIDVVSKDPNHPSSIELFDIAIRLDQESRVAASNGVVTANMVTRREMFDRVGQFDDSLMSGADAEWSQRAAEKGYNVKFVDEAVVVHPARTSLTEVLTQVRRRAGGRFDMHSGRTRKLTLFETARSAAKKLMPRIAGLCGARRRLQQRGYGWWSWLRIIPIVQLVHYSALIEIVRRKCGFEAERR